MSDKYLKSAGRNLAEGLGTELCWGWSPAVNFLDVLDSKNLELKQSKRKKQEAACPEGDGAAAGKTKTDAASPKQSDDSDDLETVELIPGSEDAVLFDMGMLEGEDLKDARLKVRAARKKEAEASSSSNQAEGGAAASSTTASNVEPFRILLCGAADVRHILRTMAALRAKEEGTEEEGGDTTGGEKTAEKKTERKQLRPVHFYLYEPNLRVHCRHLLFLKMICDATMTFAELEDRVAIFLELYGNSMLRDLTHSYLKQQSAKAIKAWGYGEGPLAKLIDTSEMKNKEKDFVEEQMRHWTRDGKTSQQVANSVSDTPDTQAATSADASASAANQADAPTAGGGSGGSSETASAVVATKTTPSGGDIKVVGLRQVQAQGSDFPVEAQWDRRVRDEMAERYDNRVNIIDWDFTMQLKDYSTQLKFPEYREWRLTGMGYDYARVNPRKGFYYEYTQPNKSLAHFYSKGFGVYCGDLKNGPFWGLGGDTANTHLTKIDFQGTIKASNGIIAMVNVRAWWYTLLTGKAWPWSEHKFAWDDPKHYNYLPPGTPSDIEHTVVLPQVKFHFVGLSIERFIMRILHNNGCAGGGGLLKKKTSATSTTEEEEVDGDEKKAEARKEAPEKAKKGLSGEGNQGFFDACFVGCNSTQFLAPNTEYDFFSLLKPKTGAIVVETIKFVVDANADAKQAFTDKVLEFASAADWELNLKKTAKLHENQVPCHTLEKADTPGNKDKALKAQKPFQLVFTKKALEKK